MEYTVQKLAHIAGVSPRTLRHYDQIGLLRPARISSSGYRIYGPKEVELLQQILLYRALEMPLDDIRAIVQAPGFDIRRALDAHKQALLQRRALLDALIQNVNHTIDSMEGAIPMSDKQRFEGFKEQMIADNEQKYGAEIREKYGEAAIEASNKKLRGMSQQDYDAAMQLAQDVNKTLAEAIATGGPAGETARKAVKMHHDWLSKWGEYPPQAHQGLGQMYVDDPRFTKYYDEGVQPGAAVFLRDAINAYYKK